MTDQVNQQPPVALLLGAIRRDHEVEELVNNPFTKQIFGTTPVVIDFGIPKWFFEEPWSPQDFEEISQRKPSLDDASKVRKWRASPQFGNFVANYLANKLKKALSPDFSRSSVRVIVLENSSEVTEHLEKALLDSFPNAFICDEDGDELSYLDSIKIEVLELDDKIQKALHYSVVHHLGSLVKKSEAKILSFPGIGKRSLEKIKAALAEHDLSLKQE